MSNDSKDSEARAGIEALYGPVQTEWRPPKGHLVLIKEETAQTASVEELQNRMCAMDEVNIALAHEDPNAFMEHVIEDVQGNALRQQYFHAEWQELMSTHDRLVVIGPRGHGKTTQVVGRVIWELGRDPDLRIKIVCATESKAREILGLIRKHIEHNEGVRLVFPDLSPDREAGWTRQRLFVKRHTSSRDASVEAVGIASSVTGGRADIIVADDVVDQRNALLLPAHREKVHQAWMSTWVPLLDPNGRIIYICTPWTMADLSQALMVNPGYCVARYPVGDRFEAIWPERYSHEKLQSLHREIGPTEFARSFWLQPRDESEAAVKAAWIQYHDGKELDLDAMYHVLSYDLAVGKTADSDYFACVHFAVDEAAGLAYVVDAWRDRISAPEQLERIASEAKRYKATALIEATAYQASMAQFLYEQEPWLDVREIKPASSKRMRVDRATPHMTRGQVRFLSRLDPVRLATPGSGDLISELLDFPLGRFDDMVDAFTMGVIWIAERSLTEPGKRNRLRCRVNSPSKRAEDDSRVWGKLLNDGRTVDELFS